jgi:hypothetical protein
MRRRAGDRAQRATPLGRYPVVPPVRIVEAASVHLFEGRRGVAALQTFPMEMLPTTDLTRIEARIDLPVWSRTGTDERLVRISDDAMPTGAATRADSSPRDERTTTSRQPRRTTSSPNNASPWPSNCRSRLRSLAHRRPLRPGWGCWTRFLAVFHPLSGTIEPRLSGWYDAGVRAYAHVRALEHRSAAPHRRGPGGPVSAPQSPQSPADLVVTNGRLCTQNPDRRSSEPLALHDGRLLAVGSNA